MYKQYKVCMILPVNPIYALSPIHTGHAGTFINIDLAVLALEAGHALTHVHGNVVLTGAAILTGMYLTLINLHLAVNP